MKRTSLFTAIVVSALFTSAIHAAPIASDSFDTTDVGAYTVSSMAGQNPTVGSTGFTGAWNTGTGAIYATNGGLTHSLTPGATLAGEVVPFNSAGSNAGRRLNRAINYTPTDGSYFMSALFQKTAQTTTLDMLAGLSPAEGATTALGSGQATYIGIHDGGIAFANAGNFTPLLTSAEMNVGETYFGLLEFDFSTTGADTVTASVFDGSSNLVAMQEFTGLALDGNIGRISLATADYAPTVITDEFRFGTQLSDVSTLTLAVPEPATWMIWSLLGLAATAFVYFRRASGKGSV